MCSLVIFPRILQCEAANQSIQKYGKIYKNNMRKVKPIVRLDKIKPEQGNVSQEAVRKLYHTAVFVQANNKFGMNGLAEKCSRFYQSAFGYSSLVKSLCQKLVPKESEYRTLCSKVHEMNITGKLPKAMEERMSRCPRPPLGNPPILKPPPAPMPPLPMCPRVRPMKRKKRRK